MSCQDKKGPFKLNQMRSIEQLRNELPARNLHELLNELNNVVCFQTQEFEYDSLHTQVQGNLMNDNDDILVIMSDGPLDDDYINALRYMDYFESSNNRRFELQCIIIYKEESASNWNGGVYNKFWSQHRRSKFPIMKQPSHDSLEIEKEYIFIYSNNRNNNLNQYAINI